MTVQARRQIPTIWVGERRYLDALTLEVLLRDFASSYRDSGADSAALVVESIADALAHPTFEHKT